MSPLLLCTGLIKPLFLLAEMMRPLLLLAGLMKPLHLLARLTKLLVIFAGLMRPLLLLLSYFSKLICCVTAELISLLLAALMEMLSNLDASIITVAVIIRCRCFGLNICRLAQAMPLGLVAFERGVSLEQ